VTASLLRPAAVAALILLVTLGAGRSAGQCPDGTWELEAATGDVTAVQTRGNVAWIAAKGGVIRVDLTNLAQGDAPQRKITEKQGLVSNDVTSLGIDGFGNIWVGTRNAGLSVFSPSGGHLADLTSFDEYVWSDLVTAIGALGDTTASTTITEPDGERTIVGDRVAVASVDSYSPQGTLEGGGMKTILVARTEDGFEFTRVPGLGTKVERVREILVEPDSIWAGTSGQGVWVYDRTGSSAGAQVALNSTGGLLSDTVKRMLRAPRAGVGGPDVLWIGTGAGVQTWDGGSAPVEEPFFSGQNVLDMFRAGSALWVLAEQEPTPGNLVRDLYRADLTQPFAPVRQPRSTCVADTLYVPRRVAVDAGGRVVLGTREDSYTVLSGGSWSCLPSLGPHSATIADLALGPNGTLYFGTGDKNRTARANGLGWFDGTSWSYVTPGIDPEMLEYNTTEVAVWPDGSVWFGSTRNATFGGLNRMDPDTHALQKYHDDVVDPTRLTLGRNIWSLELDAQSNLWVVYGQNGGGLSVIEYPSLLITSFAFGPIFAQTELLRDIAFDSRGRAWVSTTESVAPAQLYVIDTKGTIANKSDDQYSSFSVTNEIGDIAPVPFVGIDSNDQIWLAGENGLAVGQIGSDVGGRPSVSWQLVPGTGAQLGGRNPLPYTTGAFDWDDNLWLGTESAGLVRISSDLATWTWFDQVEGCPLPDQSVTGLYIDQVARRIYIGTATGGIAILDLAGVGGPTVAGLDALPFPNPWRPGSGTVLNLAGIPSDVPTSLRIYNTAGELVYEVAEARGAKTWDGRNLGSQLVEPGVYLVTAVDPDGGVYRAKVAVIR
jgi:ligand-binding sensor domain-containing protein